MKDRTRWMAAGFASLIACTGGLAPLFAQQTERPPARERPATGTPGEPGSRLPEAGQNERQGQARADRPAIAADHTANAMLVAHALGMAIDGSALQDASKKQGGGQAKEGAGQANEPRREPQAAPNSGNVDAAAQLAQHANSAFEASQKLFRQAEQAIGGAATGNPGNAEAQAPERAALAPTRGESSPVRAFYDAANQYAENLNRFCGQAGSGSTLSPQDKASICLINHGVCEVVNAWKIQQAGAMHGSGGGAWSALTAHAQEMDREGRQALQQFAFEAPDGANERPAPNGSGREQGAELRTLAQNAQQILKAIDGLAMNSGIQQRPGAGLQDSRPGGAATQGENDLPRSEGRTRTGESSTQPSPR